MITLEEFENDVIFLVSRGFNEDDARRQLFAVHYQGNTSTYTAAVRAALENR